MPRKILILTVGGSDEPLVSSIAHNKPDFIYFLCSGDTKDPPRPGSYQAVDGPGNPCGQVRTCQACGTKTGETRPSIAAQLGLESEQYAIVKIPRFDNINNCYLEASRIIREERAKDPHVKILADYTGGTKSMTAGLAAAAMDDGNVTLCVVSGKRLNLQKVEDGTQTARLIDNSPVMVEKKLQLLQTLWQGYHYQSCLSLLAEINAKPISDDALYERLEKIRFLCMAFEAWDRFDHSKAHAILKREKSSVPPKYTQFLGRIIQAKSRWAELLEEDQLAAATPSPRPGSVETPAGPDGPGLPVSSGNPGTDAQLPPLAGESTTDNAPAQGAAPPTPRRSDQRLLITFDPVYDLILNAHRRAAQGRYDDAVARLYRALEMFGQLNLLRRDEPLHTGNLNTAKLPAELRKEYEAMHDPSKGTITLALMQNYTLLSRLETPVGKIFERHKNTMQNHLKKRNNSLMAHGITPVEETDCREMLEFVEGFIDKCCEEVKENSRFDAGLQFESEYIWSC